MQNLTDRMRQLREQIRLAEARYGRAPDSVQLLAVSKQQPAECIARAHALGQTDFGENYLQEALEKIACLAALPINWHFIGHIQSNKTRPIAENFAWAHCVDRLKVAKRLNDQRPENFKPLNICLRIRLDDEPGKEGISTQEALDIAPEIATLPRLKLRGLMTIPMPHAGFDAQRSSFARLRVLLETLQNHGLAVDTLSMGMSGDFHAAIAEGATIIRVGTAIFGSR